MTPSREEKIAAFRRLNDPAGNLYWIARARRLHPERLAVSNAIDVPLRRGIRWPHPLEWAGAALAAAVIVGAIMVTP